MTRVDTIIPTQRELAPAKVCVTSRSPIRDRSGTSSISARAVRKSPQRELDRRSPRSRTARHRAESVAESPGGLPGCSHSSWRAPSHAS